MHLSTAINMGAVTVKMKAGDMNSCALGAACNALGAHEHTTCLRNHPNNRYEFLYKHWPWVDTPGYKTLSGRSCEAFIAIYTRFDSYVVKGSMTLEQLVDYVRSIEPECGECNEFSCKCVQKMDETPTLQLQEVRI